MYHLYIIIIIIVIIFTNEYKNDEKMMAKKESKKKMKMKLKKILKREQKRSKKTNSVLLLFSSSSHHSVSVFFVYCMIYTEAPFVWYFPPPSPPIIHPVIFCFCLSFGNQEPIEPDNGHNNSNNNIIEMTMMQVHCQLMAAHISCEVSLECIIFHPTSRFPLSHNVQ